MTHTETASPTAEIVMAIRISDLPGAPDHPLSRSYSVSASAAECFAVTRKWIEAFGIDVDDARGSMVGGTITVTIINAGKAFAATSVHDAHATGHSVVDELPNHHASDTRLNADRADTRAEPILDADTDLGDIAPLIESGPANENSGSALWTHRLCDVNQTSFLIALVVAFYATATAISLYSAAAGSREAIGYLASLFVFGSFGCRTMVPLRLLALASNVAFMAYAVRNQLAPVLVLHALLLPTNIVRLWQILATRRLALHLPHLSQDST